MPSSPLRGHLPWPALVVLAVGAVAAVVAAALLHARSADQVELLADTRAQVVAQEISAELERHRDLAVLAAAWLETTTDPTAVGFNAFLERTGLGERYPALAAVMVVRPVGQQPAVTEPLLVAPDPIAEPITGYVVSAGRAADGQAVPYGHDLADAPEAVAAMLAARATGASVLSDPYLFLTDRDLSMRDRQHGLLLAAPVHAGGERAPGSVRAWAVVAFRGDELLASLLRTVGQGYEVMVSDPQVPGLVDGRQIGTLADGGRIEPATQPLDAMQVERVELGGQQWLVEVRALPGSLAGIETTKPWLAAFQLGVMTLAIALLVGRLTTARDRAVDAVKRATADLERANQELGAKEQDGRRTAATLAAIVEGQRELAAVASDPEALLDLVAVQGQRLTGATGAVVELLEGDALVYRHVTGAAATHAGLRVPAGTSLSGRCVDTAEVLRTDDVETDGRVDAAACLRIGLRSMVVAPLFQDDAVVGVLKVLSSVPDAFDDGTEWSLTLLAGTVEAALGASRRFEARAMHDSLTGLATRALFQARLRTACARSHDSGTEVAVLFVDLDGFKAINDTYGHAAGDLLLQAAAGRLRAAVRPDDTVGRYGGDEFAVACVVDEVVEARHIQRRIQASLDGDPVEVDGMRLALHASVGLATSGPAPPDCGELLGRADADMYRVKHRRRPSSAPSMDPDVNVRL